MAVSDEIWMPQKVHNHDIKSAYRNDGQRQDLREVSDTFAITNGVKQGCVLDPMRFSIFLSAKLEEAFRDMGTESTSNHARLQTSLQLNTLERRQ